MLAAGYGVPPGAGAAASGSAAPAVSPGPIGPGEPGAGRQVGARAEVGAGGRAGAWLGGLALGLVGAGALLATGLTLGLAARSLRWPLIHDAALLHYIAWRILEGAAPYRDLLDMNFPGVYLLHMATLTLLGDGDGAFRVLDFLLLAGTGAGLAVALRSFGGWAAAAGPLLFALGHLAGGAWRAAQRDMILCLPLAWLLAGLLGAVETGRLRPLALAAGSLGAAVWVKPHALLLLPLLAGLALRRRRGRAAALGVVALGLGLPAAGVLAWLAARGGLGAFADLVVGWLLPVYPRIGREPLWAAVRGHDWGLPVLAGLGLWAGGGLAALGAGGRRGAAAGLAAGVLYGGLHFALQGKGWEYHLYPLILFLVAAGAAGLGLALGPRPAGLGVARPGAAAVLGVALLLAAGSLGAKGVRNLDPQWIRVARARAHAVAAALAPVARAGGTIQVLDTTRGGLHALYLLRARVPTRFLYDFPLYEPPGHAAVRRFRAEFLAALAAEPPDAVVLFERGWPAGGYERVERFPAFARWLADQYRFVCEGEGFRVFVRRRPPGEAGAVPREGAGCAATPLHA